MQITYLEKFISEQTREWLFPRREQLNNGTTQWQTFNRNICLLAFDLNLLTLVNNKLGFW